MGRLLLVGLLAFAVALAGTAYAEVQSIKVSGDIDIKAITQSNYDLKLTQENRAGTDAGGDAADSDDDDVRFTLSTVRVRVDADLTDNVSTSVRLLNQRVWDSDADAATTDPNSVNIDNAYVTLKEFLYSPLTVIAGRQNLTYGTGFIVGNGLLADPDGVFASLTTGAAPDSQAQHGQEHSAYNSYDAIRLILDYAPLTVEAVWAKINETGTQDDDETLYGALVNYKLDRWEAEVEPYWFYKDDEAAASALGTAGGVITVNDASAVAGTLRTYEIQRTHTVGLRVAASPIENLKLSGEGAHQFGEIIDLTLGPGYQERDRDAWGANIYANYTWAQVPWAPATGVGWTYFSGEETSGIASAAGGGASNLDQRDDFSAWDPVYRGSFTTFIQDFFSGRDAAPNLYATFDVNDTNATTNRHLIYGDLKFSPMEDVTLWGRWTHVRFDKEPRPSRDSHVGDELDVKALYDYTEDVQLAAWGGWFLPGSYYDEPESNSRGNQLAWTLGAGGSVKF